LIGIYGAGYLGNYIHNYLKENGLECSFLERDELPTSKFDIIIDAGFPRNYQNWNVRKRYKKKLRERTLSAMKQGSFYLYLGSFSSRKLDTSTYGRIKRESEEIVKSLGGRIWRLGLVLDTRNPGGRYKELIEILARFPVNVRISEAWCPIHITPIEDFNNSLDYILANNIRINHKVEYQIIIN
jgi:hypothetical protein